MELEGADAAGEKASAILRRFRERGDDHPCAPYIGAAGLDILPAGTRGAEIHESVRPRARRSSRRTSQQPQHAAPEKLDGLGVKNLVAGMMTHMCVDASVRHAADLGYKITLLGDACATRTQSYGGEKVPARQVHAAFLAALNGFYAKVVNTHEL